MAGIRIDEGYHGNPNLVKAGTKITYTQQQLDELKKCADDPVYFAEHYIKIIHVDHGLVNFIPYDFQKKMLKAFQSERRVIIKSSRQIGKSTTTIAYLLWLILFREKTTVGLLANKGSTARELLGKARLAYENLPKWMQQGVVTWNKGDIELENGSRIIATATTSDSVRGYVFNCIFLDEFAFVPNNQAEEFFTSVYPTISSGKSSQVIIVSTPNGLNKFYTMWTKAIKKISNYCPIEVNWWEVPGRDQKFKEDIIAATSQRQWDQEFEAKFIGSTNTLIAPSKIEQLGAEVQNPVRQEEGLDIYELPILSEFDPFGGEIKKGHVYVIVVDVARGQGLDYSAFSVIDVTEVPYKQVAKWRQNEISPMVYPTYIYNLARFYNNAFVLVETSDIGQQVADILHYELEYENLVKVAIKGKQGQQISEGYQTVKKVQFGVKTSGTVKRMGCANLKTLIESDKLKIVDEDTILELTTFVAHKDSFAAEEGNHDDLAMTLVLFGWWTSQRHFRESMKEDIRKILQKEQASLIDDEMLPFGIINDGREWLPDIDSTEDDKKEVFDMWVEGRLEQYPFDAPTLGGYDPRFR